MHQRQGQPETRTTALNTPRLNGAAVQAHIFGSDRQAQARTAQGTFPGSIGTPETVKYLRRLFIAQTNTMVTDGDAQRRLAGGNIYVNGLRLAVLNSVKQQVAEHTFNTHPVHIHHNLLLTSVNIKFSARAFKVWQGLLKHIHQNTHKVMRIDIRQGATGIKPGNFEQVSQQILEPSHLIMQQLNTSALHGREILPPIIQQLGT